MNFVLRKNLLFFSPSSCSRSPARAFLVRLRVREFSFSSHHWRRTEEDFRSVRVSVWWDFENCGVPTGVQAFRVGPAITEALRANGIKGPLQITAFGDVLQLSRANQEALVCTGIRLNHIPNGGMNNTDKYVDLMYWASQNPPPAHLFLISGDRNFAGLLHRLRMINYNILLAVPGNAPDVFCSAATIMWQWPSLLKGENLTGKHFNHPPDGAFGSWYGNSKVPLENPFSAIEQSTSSQNEEISEPSVDLKLGAVPKSVVRQVRHILSSHPKGISISDLRSELTKCDVRLDKNLYGYKILSRFLLTIPHVKLQPLGDGNFCVRLISSEYPEPFESSVVPLTASTVHNEERGYEATAKLNVVDKNMATNADETPSITSLHEKIADADSKSFQPVHSQGKPIGDYVDGKAIAPSLVRRDACQPPNELQKSSLLSSEKVVNVANAQLSEIVELPKDNKVSKFKTDSIKMRSENLSDIARPMSEDATHEIMENYTSSRSQCARNDHTMVEKDGTANYESENFEMNNKDKNLTEKEVDGVCQSSNSSLVDDSLVDKRAGGSSENNGKSPTFFSWIRSWWPLWKTSAKSDDLTACQNKVEESHVEDSKLDQNVSHFEVLNLSELEQNGSHSGKHELFSRGSFWNDIESFVFTANGSLLFTLSRSREDVAHKLQKDGPLVLRSLTEKDILQLVELLIAEKKWLEESPTQAFPFKLTQPVRKSTLMGQSHGANGLRSLFLSKTSHSTMQKPFEHDVEKHNQSIPQTSVSTVARETKYSETAKKTILRDCEKLVSEILRKHPEGYNIGCFRKLFADTYGYNLDLQKLGYQKMALLLQIMPGVRIESTYIFPADPSVCVSDEETSTLKTHVTNACHEVSNSDSELSDSASKDDKLESLWEELGPVSAKNSNHSDLESTLSLKVKELDTSKHPDYEPIVSDYDSSNSEGDRSCLSQEEVQRKTKYNEQGSSVAEVFGSSSESTLGTLSDIPARNNREKKRPRKNYSFVADPVSHNKDKLIDGILDGFKKAGESKMQN